MRHTLKHLTKVDGFFLVFLAGLIGLSIYVGDWRGAIFSFFLVVYILVIARYRGEIEHRDKFIGKLLEDLEGILKAIEGRKVVKTTTYSLEKVKAKDGQKNKSKANESRTRGASSRRKPATGANSKAKGTASVSKRKSTRTAKNSKA